MTNSWECLDFWRSKEWVQIQETLDELDRQAVDYNPDRADLFAVLDLITPDRVKVVIVGQDPYPVKKFCTGIAFSIPATEPLWPPTLCQIITEYVRDLHYTTPTTGSLVSWVEKGVLLWNAVPSYFPEYTTERTKLNACRNWPWHSLTQQIIERVSSKPQGIVYAFLGNVAREFVKYARPSANPCIETSHPSPRASLSSKHPFRYSRIFSTINAKLVELRHQPIDWRLPGSHGTETTDVVISYPVTSDVVSTGVPQTAGQP